MNDWVKRGFALAGVAALYLGVRRYVIPKLSPPPQLQKGPMRFVQATHYTPGPRRAPPNTIGIHTIESPEDDERAYNTARWTFAGPNARAASTHFLVDAKEVVQAVRVSDIAWGAEGANARGIHVEHAGYAGQNAGQWSDPYSISMLERSAELTAALARQYNIPIRKLTWQELKAGEPGFFGHVDANLMHGNGIMPTTRPFDHNDPGPSFPWEYYLGRVRFYHDSGAPSPAFANA